MLRCNLLLYSFNTYANHEMSEEKMEQESHLQYTGQSTGGFDAWPPQPEVLQLWF
jgi:hypothetical protein